MTSGPQPEDFDHSKPGWYLALMAPRDKEKGNEFAWLDPSRIYMFPQAFKACIEDLTSPFRELKIDVVIGIDAMGFVLGGAIASDLGVGFQAIRKVNKLCVPTEKEYFDHYLSKTGQKSCLEMRKDPFKPGTRVLLVDQWIQTGGTMGAACRLVERAKGEVAGIAVICKEDSEKGKMLDSNYKIVHCTPPEFQAQVNAQWLDSFKLFPGCE